MPCEDQPALMNNNPTPSSNQRPGDDSSLKFSCWCCALPDILINRNKKFKVQILRQYFVRMSNHPRDTQRNSNKPVNINISFTINPKNIMKTPFKNGHCGRRLSREDNLLNTHSALSGRADNLSDYLDAKQSKHKRTNKRISVDETTLRQAKIMDSDKSVNLRKIAETTQVRKSQAKPKNNSELFLKKQYRGTAKHHFNQVRVTNSVFVENGGLQTDRKTQLPKNWKSMLYNLAKNEFSKRSLPQSPAQPHRTKKIVNKKKQKKRSPKKGTSEVILMRDTEWKSDIINRQKLIDKLTSIQSMNHSLLMGEQEKEVSEIDRRTIVVNTENSMDCLEEIHDMESKMKWKENSNISSQVEIKASETFSIIETYIALMNEELQGQGIDRTNDGEEDLQEDQRDIDQIIKQQLRDNDRLKGPGKAQNQQQVQAEREQAIRGDRAKNNHIMKETIELESDQREARPQKEDEPLRLCLSSELTKQQQLLNELERVKLRDLKKHEVEKWEELLSFIQQSVESGEVDTEQVLHNVYFFLERTKNDLQYEINKPVAEPGHSSEIDAFTNKLASIKNEDSAKIKASQEKAGEQDHRFDSISSMSFKDEDYENENEELKMVNLEMIDNALKSRYKKLMERKEREESNLMEKCITGKITEKNMREETHRISKWMKNEMGEITKARKRLWKGYSEAKGILEKSEISRQFEEEFESGKKKSMMKCLSEDYLLKKDLRLSQQKLGQQEEERSESSEFVFDRKKNIDNDEKVSTELLKDKDIDQESIDSSNRSLRRKEESLRDMLLKQHDENSFEYEEDENYFDENDIGALRKEDNIDLIKDKLNDIREKRLVEDLGAKEAAESPNLSYEEVENELRESESEEEPMISNEFEAHPFSDSDYEKLKYICAEDKEDIFEFIFLDLSIELYQEPCLDNHIMESINRYIAKSNRQARKKKGVKTSLNVVKEYLKRFTGFVLRINRSALQSMDQAVGPTAIEMLKYMHENEEEPRDEEEAPSTLILPTSVFDEFEKQFLPSLEFEVYYQDNDQRESKRVDFLKSIMHIHNKALFDAMNQYLDTMRPYGIWGKPFPWKQSSEFMRPTSDKEKEEKLQKSTEKVFEYCSYVCGLLVDKEESLVGSANLSEEYLSQIKEDRLSRMLATQLIDNEKRWLFYDDEETEVLVKLSTSLSHTLFLEAIQEINNINQ